MTLSLGFPSAAGNTPFDKQSFFIPHSALTAEGCRQFSCRRLCPKCLLRCGPSTWTSLRSRQLRHPRSWARHICVHVHAAERTPWEILEVKPGSNDKDLKKAFKNKARQLHPDVNKAPDASQRFMECRQAYVTLTDPRLREEYERKARGPATADWNWTGPTTAQVRQAAEETWYGFTEFFKDLDADLKARRQRRDREPASLWEELSDIGEEFVEFLEEATGTRSSAATGQASGAKQQQQQQSRSAREAANRAAAESRRAAEEEGAKAAATAAKAQQDADQEIERMLQELKRNASRSSD